MQSNSKGEDTSDAVDGASASAASLNQPHQYDAVARWLLIVGGLAIVGLAVGTFSLDKDFMVGAFGWSGFVDAMTAPTKILALGCGAFLLLPLVRNIALLRSFHNVDGQLGKSARILLALSTSIVIATLIYALL